MLLQTAEVEELGGRLGEQAARHEKEMVKKDSEVRFGTRPGNEARLAVVRVVSAVAFLLNLLLSVRWCTRSWSASLSSTSR